MQMNGIQNYDEKIVRMINHKLEDYPDLTDFVDYLSDKGSLNTNYNYLNQIIRFLEKAKKTDSALTDSDYHNYLDSLAGKTAGYQRCAYFALKKYSEYLYLNKITTKDPMKYIAAPKSGESNKTKDKRENAYLTREEIEITLANLEYGVGSHQAKAFQEQWKERDTAIMLIFLSTGISSSTLYKLDLNSVNLENATLTVKGRGNKTQIFVLPERTLRALHAWIIKRSILLQGKDQEALFISKYRSRLSQCAISDLVKKYTFDVEGKQITPQKLRATYGVQLYNETKDLRLVQEQMGHVNLQSTELYIRDNQSINSKRAADIMSKFLD